MLLVGPRIVGICLVAMMAKLASKLYEMKQMIYRENK